MIETSKTYKEKISAPSRRFKASINVYKLSADGEYSFYENFDDSSVLQDGLLIEDGVSTPNQLQVGCAAISQLTLNLLNPVEEPDTNPHYKYTSMDFYNDRLDVSIGLVIQEADEETGASEIVEWINRGSFFVDDVDLFDGEIRMIALDAMSKFDKEYNTSLTYPTTLYQILSECCQNCNVTLDTTEFPNYQYSVNTKPPTVETYREMISYIAQLAGCFARINNSGHLYLDWYDIDKLITSDGLDGGVLEDYTTGDVADGGTLSDYTSGYVEDGGTFRSYSNEGTAYGGNFIDYTSGDTVNGGNFTDYSSGDTISGGNFTEQIIFYNTIEDIFETSINSEDVRITGIKIKDINGNIHETGTDEYVIEILENPLVQENSTQIISTLHTKFSTFYFRPYELKALSDPSIEAGDAVVIKDRFGHKYNSIVSNLLFNINDTEDFSADSETRNTNNSVIASLPTIKVTQQEIENTKSSTSLVTNIMGFYETTETAANGDIISYVHNKPSLSESETIWKKTSSGITYSGNGGESWSNIQDETGTIINDWIKTQKITSTNGYVYFDLANGIISASQFVKEIPNTNTRISTNIGADSWINESGVVETRPSFMVSLEEQQASSDFQRTQVLLASTNADGDNQSDPDKTLLKSGGDLYLSSNAMATYSSGGQNWFIMAKDTTDDINEGIIQISRANNSEEESEEILFSNKNETFLTKANDFTGDVCTGNYIQIGLQNINIGLNKSENNSTNTKISFLVAGNEKGYIDQTGGHFNSLYADGVQVTSDRDKKTNIQKLDVNAVKNIENIQFFEYDIGSKHINMGVMYDEAPDIIKDTKNKSIDLYSYISLTTKAVIELSERVKQLEETLAERSDI